MKRNRLWCLLLLGVLSAGFSQAKSSFKVTHCKMDSRNYSGEKWGEFQIRFNSQVDSGWLDELTIDFYLATQPGSASGLDNKPWLLFHKQVKYVDVMNDNHDAVVYMHYSPFKRYVSTSVSRPKYAAVFSVGGKEIAIEGSERDKKKWWESDLLQQKSGYFMNREESPFYSQNPSDYNMLKPQR